MITKKEYIALKKYLKFLSKPQIDCICDDMELTDSERETLIAWYRGDSTIKIAMDNYESCRSYTNHMKILFSKINNYFIYKNISF